MPRSKPAKKLEPGSSLPAAPPAPPVVDPAILNQVIAWVVSGETEHAIRQSIAAAYPDVDPSAALLAAMFQVERNAHADPALVMAWTFECARDLYRRMAEANDFAGALKALKFMNDTAVAMNAMPKADPDVPESSPKTAGTGQDQ